MLSYETAVKLREAGFPQKRTGLFGIRNHVPLKNGDLIIEGTVYKPPLDELIEACGDSLYKIHRVWGEGVWTTWCADFTHNPITGKEISGRGISPEEAVANLWLALNKTKT